MKFSTKACIVTALAAAFTFAGPSAYAGRTWAKDTVVCVPSDAVAEVSHMQKIIDTPAQDAVAEVSHEEKVVDVAAVAEVWANFSPNDSKATFIGPALYPIDVRGTWNVHDKIPGGHEGADGVYAKGNPDKGGNWFYRLNAVVEVFHMQKVIDTPAKDAVDEVFHMIKVIDTAAKDAVTCEKKPSTGTSSVSHPEKPEKPSKGTSSVHNHKPQVDTPDALPHTGADEWALTFAGLGLIAAGIGAVTFYRKRP